MAKTYFTLYKLALVAAITLFSFIVWMIYLANSGSNSIFFDLVRSLPYGDKLGHFGLFGTLSFVVIIATGFKSFTIGRLAVYYGVVIVLTFIIAEEISQAFITTRTFDLIDLSAGAVGVLLAAAMCYLLNKYRVKYYKTNK